MLANALMLMMLLSCRLHPNNIMRVGLIIYGDLSITSGGYLYDRQLVRYLQEQGDEVEIISLPWRNYGRHLLDNLRLILAQRLRQSNFDILLQDELNHPSLFWLNRRLRSHITFPLISIVHHLRSSEQHPKWQLKFFRQVERSYLQTIDGFVFNSETTRATVIALSGQDKPGIVAYPAGNHVPGTCCNPAIRPSTCAAKRASAPAIRRQYYPSKGLASPPGCPR